MLNGYEMARQDLQFLGHPAFGQGGFLKIPASVFHQAQKIFQAGAQDGMTIEALTQNPVRVGQHPPGQARNGGIFIGL